MMFSGSFVFLLASFALIAFPVLHGLPAEEDAAIAVDALDVEQEEQLQLDDEDIDLLVRENNPIDSVCDSLNRNCTEMPVCKAKMVANCTQQRLVKQLSDIKSRAERDDRKPLKSTAQAIKKDINCMEQWMIHYKSCADCDCAVGECEGKSTTEAKAYAKETRQKAYAVVKLLDKSDKDWSDIQAKTEEVQDRVSCMAKWVYARNECICPSSNV